MFLQGCSPIHVFKVSGNNRGSSVLVLVGKIGSMDAIGGNVFGHRYASVIGTQENVAARV